MILSWASTATGPWMLQSEGRQLLLLSSPRTVQSGASGLSRAAWPRPPFGVAPQPWLCCCGARCPALRHPAPAVAWHLTTCRRSGWRRASLACLVAPQWCATPCPVGSLSVLRSAFLTPWCLSPSRGVSSPDLLGGCAGHAEAGREPGSLCLPLAPAEAGALGSLRVVPVRGPAMRLSHAGPSGVSIGLLLLRWLACVDPGTDASGFPYCPSFHGGLRRCTGAVLWPCGSKDATPGSRVCVRVLVLPGRVGRAGLPGAFWCASPFLWPFCPLALLGPLRAWVAPLCWCVCLLSVVFFVLLPLLFLAFAVFRPLVSWALVLLASPPPLPPFFFFGLPALFGVCFLLPSFSTPLCPSFFLFFLFCLLHAWFGVWSPLHSFPLPRPLLFFLVFLAPLPPPPFFLAFAASCFGCCLFPAAFLVRSSPPSFSSFLFACVRVFVSSRRPFPLPRCPLLVFCFPWSPPTSPFFFRCTAVVRVSFLPPAFSAPPHLVLF